MIAQDIENLWDEGLVAVADAIAMRNISALTITEAALERIAVHADALNCFRTIEADEALDAARRADNILKRGETPGPLHGVPLAHKDIFYRKGKIVSCGSKIRSEFRPSITAGVITRMKKAGAVTLGTLNLSEFAMGPTGCNPHYGLVRNPWNIAYVSGGSSSGSAAAVAARFVAGSLGSDTGGSTRVPAALCGVTGLKPTQGLVSCKGVMPLSHSLDTVGTLARSASDCARLLDVIVAQDGNHEKALDGDLRSVRIAVPHAIYDAINNDLHRKLVEDTLYVLKQRGATLIDITLPDFQEINAMSGLVFVCEAATIHRSWLTHCREDYGPQVRNRLDSGLCYPATRYIEALSLRAVFLRKFLNDTLQDADLLHLPAVPYTAPTFEEAMTDDVAEGFRLNALLVPFMGAANYLGVPAISAPAGFAQESLPVGFQLMGRPFEDATLLQAVDALQRDTDWHLAKPDL